MRILVCDDDPSLRRLVSVHVKLWGHEAVCVGNGAEALDALQEEGAPRMAILDWVMPEMDGLEVCRRARALGEGRPLYIVMLTARRQQEDILRALEAGADEFVTKPFDPAELRARIQVGARLVQLQADLAERVCELEEALTNVKQLQGLLPICGYCKRIRADDNYWQQLEQYFAAHADVRFSHGICPECYETIVKPEIAAFARSRAANAE